MNRTDDRRAHIGLRRSLLVGLCWWALLAGVYMLYVGEWDAVDWIGATATGLISGGVAAVLARQGLLTVNVKLGWFGQMLGVAVQIVADFGLVTARLARLTASRRRDSGAFVARELPAGNGSPGGRSWRAFVTVASTFSPNSYVVDIDPDTGVRLSHDLVRHRASERPA
jgi:hypothetical protein